MKILLVGDIHFRSKNLTDISGAWKRILDLAKAQGVGLILQAGDVFDIANIHTKEADVGTVYDSFVSPLKESGIPFLCVIGNHDIGQAKDKDALATIDKYDWVRVIRKPGIFKLEELDPNLKGFSVCTLPWLYKEHLLTKMKVAGVDAKEAQQKIDKTMSGMMDTLGKLVSDHRKEEPNFVIFLGHVEITGSMMANGRPQTGGTFEYSPADLAKVGADAYALAHIHVRQSIPGLPNENDGYIGNLCQLSFGEELSIPGVRMIDVVDGKIVKDILIENTFSPRHYTVDTLDGLKYRKGIDRVKVIGEIKPEELPEGVIFEKKIKISERDISEGCLNCDTPLDELLKQWITVSKSSVDLAKLTACANDLISQAKIPSDSIGSLEKINFINLKNVTSHLDTKLDLSSLKGICGIEGSNGSGKTTTIEAILVGLYGKCPSRPYLPSLITQGCNDTAEVEVGFTSKGIEYKVRREFKLSGKTFHHSANLYRIASGEDGEDELLAGPKVGAVDIQCGLLVGDPKLVLAGVFSSQGDAGSILDLNPSERKDLFAKLLGTDKFLLLSEMAKKNVLATNAEIEAVKGKALRLENETLDETQDIKNLENIKQTILNLEGEIKDKEALLNQATTELQEIAVANKSVEIVLNQIQEYRERRNKIMEQGKAGKAKLLEIRQMIGIDLSEEFQKLTEAKTELDSLRKRAQVITEEKNQIITQSLEHKKIAAEMQASANDQYTKYLKEANSKNDLIRKEFSDKQSKANTEVFKSESGAESVRRRLEEARRKAKLIEGFPNEEVCKRCPLAEDGIAGRESILILEEELQKVEALVSVAKKNLQEIGHPKLDAIQSQEEFCKDLFIKVNEEKTKAAELEKQSSLKVIPQEFKDQAASLKELIATEPELRKKATEAENASHEAAQLEGSLKELAIRLKEIDEHLAKTPAPAKIDSSSQKLVVEAVNKEIDSQKAVLKSLLIDQGKLETSLDTYKKKKSEAKTLLDSISSKEEAASVMNALAAAFGRDGIPQMIVDSAIPHFQDLMASQMMDFEGRWTIEVASQKMNRDGSIKEVIEINVDDGDGPREISTYSGGERKLLKSIIRIAFSSLMAQRSGNGLKILVLDEATDSMDENNAGNFIKMLARLSGMFNQVYVVSHNDRILSTIQNRLEFSRLPGHHTTLAKKGNW